MPPSQLSPLQRRVLLVLADARPAWTLTGGGALVGMHLGHRTTRDLDLFWHGLTSLADASPASIARLRAAGLSVDVVQTSPAFQQLRVSDAETVVVVDFVADPVPTIEQPVEVDLEGTIIQVDTAHEILVNKLCALLGRSEIRDLVDVRALLLHGLDLKRALDDAPRKDGGFSPLTLAWVLRQQPLHAMASATAIAGDVAAELVRFRDELVRQLLDVARPPP
jgi:hypothetical protein